jgi:hypothetical protein
MGFGSTFVNNIPLCNFFILTILENFFTNRPLGKQFPYLHPRLRPQPYWRPRCAEGRRWEWNTRDPPGPGVGPLWPLSSSSHSLFLPNSLSLPHKTPPMISSSGPHRSHLYYLHNCASLTNLFSISSIGSSNPPYEGPWRNSLFSDITNLDNLNTNHHNPGTYNHNHDTYDNCDRTPLKKQGFVSQDTIRGISTKRECINTHISIQYYDIQVIK